MKLFVIATALVALSACASFPSGTKVAPAFSDDQFQLSQNAKVPVSQEPATLGQLGR
jgi:starvation-inducible outer membrane lipoprotein